MNRSWVCLTLVASTTWLLPNSVGAQTAPARLPNAQFSTAGLVSTVAVQDDGKIIIGGSFSSVNGVTRSNIARLNPDGTLDQNWNPAANGSVAQVVVHGTDVFV